MTAVPIDLQARVRLAHAAVQALAEQHGIDLLHVKGPALDATLSRPDRPSSDADVLVRPAQVAAFTAHLRAHGWRLVTDFASGSAFEHAANYHHDHWGYVDVHRVFPGITVAPDEAFELLWSERGATLIAHRPCPVPGLLDQALVLCLHAARAMGGARAARDLEAAWYDGDDDRRQVLRERAHELRADVALAAALGELDRYPDDRTTALWRFYSQGGSRIDEWVARIRAAPTRRAALGITVRGLGVNREFAAMELGHEPSVRELAGIFFGRFGTAFRLLGRRLTGRRGRRT